MSFVSRVVKSATVAVLAALPLVASAQVRITAHPEVRVVAKVDPAVRTTLTGSMPAAVGNAAIGSRLTASTQLNHVMLLLKPSDTQVAALHTLLDAQQDKNSPFFHKWLTPDTYAQSFGVAPADIAKVTAWLQDSGLTVESVSKSTRVIQFSGPVSAVESAFSTEIHNVSVNGEAHISNTSEIAVPDALTPVIQGLVRLNNFFPTNGTHKYTTYSPQHTADAASVGPVAPDSTNAAGSHRVSPGDAAIIFNSKPLTTASPAVDGTGVTIAVLARSNISLGDVAQFRSMFGLAAKNPTVTVVGTDPGFNSDDTEAYLDAEWAGALAPNANVNFIVNGVSLISGGVDGAGLYAVDNNIGDIISLSYGGCEKNFGSSGTAFWNTLWEQAAAQGQTAFVSTGDSDAAGCDSANATYATGGYGVNALGSSAYNVAVGGSIFVDPNPTTYWGGTAPTASPFINALSYVPEASWNQSRLATYLNNASTAFVSGSGIVGTGGGISLYTARPSWQTGSGISATADPTDYNGAVVPLTGTTVTGLHRLVPDVTSISASAHDPAYFCASGLCQVDTTGNIVSVGLIGGTSLATPAMASAQALINQKNGGRQGNANIYYYQLANNQYTASTTTCQATNGTVANPTVTLPAATCNFQDIVSGSNVAPTASSGTAGIGFNAGTGFDETTGLGSLNINNVATNWSSVTFNATATTFTLNPATSTHGANQAFTVQVTPASGSGTPTGDVAIIASTQTAYGAPQVFTLTSGSAAGNLNSLPGGTYTVYARYAGDGTYASSVSAPVIVTIAKEASTIAFTPYLVAASGSVTNLTSFTYGTGEIYLDTDLTGASSNGTYINGIPNTGAPSGAVTYTVTRNGSTQAGLTTSLDTYGTTYLLSGVAFPNFYLVPNYQVLTPGSYSVVASYAGDTSFNASSATTAFTVVQATPALSLTTSTSQINSGGPATFNFSVTAPSTAAAAATGTVQFVDTTTSTTLGTAPLTNGAAVFTTPLITATGANTITATYSGDTNYATGSTTTVVTVGTSTAPTVAVTTTGTQTVGASITVTATLSAAANAASTVTFYDGATVLGSATVANGGTTASIAVRTFTAGGHSLTATYAGTPGATTPQAAATSTPTVITIAQNTTSTVLSTPTTGQYGNVVLVVKINRSPTNTGAPYVGLTGTVTFMEGATVLATSTPYFDPAGYYLYTASATLNSLAPGSHNISAVYSGDANFSTSTSNTTTITVTKGVPTASAVPSSVVYGTATTTLTGMLAYGGTTAPTGGVTIGVDGGATVAATCTGTTSPLTCTANNYNSFPITAGAHTITVTYGGDTNYNATTGTNAFTVTKATPAITPNAKSVTYGTGNTSISATLAYSGAAAPQGAVTLQVDSLAAVTATCTGSASPLTCTVASYNISTLSGGQHTITAVVATGPNYLTTSGTGTLTVTPSPATTVTVSSQSIAYGSTPTTLNASIAYTGSAMPTGAVTFMVDSGSAVAATCSGTSSRNCSASYPTGTLTGGQHTITVTEAADANYSAMSGTGTLTVNAAGTPVITVASQSITYGSTPTTLSASIAYSGSSVPTGTVTFMVDSGSSVAATCMGSASPLSCTASYPTGTLASGTHTITVTEAADSNYAMSTGSGTLTVNAAGAPVITVASQSITYGSTPTTLSASIAYSGSAVPTGAVSFTVDNGSAVAGTCTGSSSPRTCSASYPTGTLTGGTHTISVTEAADSNYAATSGSGTLTVNQATTPITFTVANHTYGDAPFTVSASSSSTGAFTYSVVSGPATVSGNTVTLTGAGTVTLRASQAADSNYAANSQTATFTVTAASTTTTVTSSLNPSTAGAPVTFTATVAAAQGPVPTGNVVFSDGSTVLATVALTNGVASYTTSALTAGAHTITAAYQTNGNDAASSGAVTQTVAAAALLTTTTALNSNNNPSLFSTPVTFAATVLYNSSAVVTGNVVFADGTTTLATVALVNGTATYTTSTLSVGSHAITATYQGNAVYATSSGKLTQVVNPATFSLTDGGASSFSLTIARGSSGTTTISVNPTPSFAGTVTLTCSNLPANVTCYFFNPTLTFTGSGGAQTSALRIDAYQLTSAIRPVQMSRNDTSTGTRLALSFALPGLLLAGLGARSRKLLGSQRLMLLAFLVIGLAGAATLTGCGTGMLSPSPATAGTYTVNVVASSGSTTQTLPITLTIQ